MVQCLLNAACIYRSSIKYPLRFYVSFIMIITLRFWYISLSPLTLPGFHVIEL